MKTYLRLLGFAKPIEKYAIPYFIFSIFYAIFNTFNFVMIIPIVSALFNVEGVNQIAAVETLPRLNLRWTTSTPSWDTCSTSFTEQTSRRST